MATIKSIKRRTKAAKNISQITKAMEMVAASKMRRAQEKALASRPYADKIDLTLKRMSGHINPEEHFLLQTPEVQEINTIAILVFSTDKGLAGSLNTNLFKALEALEKRLSEKHADLVLKFVFVTIGKKAREFILKTGRTLHAEFTNFPDRPAYEDTLPISRVLLDGFKSKRFYAVYLLYDNFVSTLTQKPKTLKLLPISTEELETLEPETTRSSEEEATEKLEYLFEPDSRSILDWLLPYYFELQVYQRLLEAQASEHSARMVTMRNASDNAKEIVHYLKLEYNRKRQAAITNEIADIVTSGMAVGQ